MSVKVLVLGSTGMLGSMVLKVLSKEKGLKVFGTHISDNTDLFYFNVEDGLEKLNLLYEKSSGFDYFVNCIGFTADKIDSADSFSIIKAITLNAIFPHQLADFVGKRNVRLLHISTDGVFAGKAETYSEDSPCDCADIYGKTKSLGEVVNNKNVINIRCSIIGPSPFEKRGLFEWFSSQPEGATIPGYTNHLWNGVTTYQFAELCCKIIKDNRFNILREESSVFHFAPNHPVTKYQLLKILKSILNKNVTITPVEHSKGEVKRVLISRYERWKELYSCNIPMESAIKQMVDFIKDNT